MHYHLVFLGSGFPSYAELLAEPSLAGRIHFLAPVRPTEVVPFIRTANVGMLLYLPVAPGITHCLPNRFFQPIAAGIPLLYPQLPEITRLADRYEIGLTIDPTDPHSIAARILEFSANPTTWETRKASVARAQRELSWECDEVQLKELIEGIIGAPELRPNTRPQLTSPCPEN